MAGYGYGNYGLAAPAAAQEAAKPAAPGPFAQLMQRAGFDAKMVAKADQDPAHTGDPLAMLQSLTDQ